MYQGPPVREARLVKYQSAVPMALGYVPLAFNNDKVTYVPGSSRQGGKIGNKGP